jgi:hypothetical protein
LWPAQGRYFANNAKFYSEKSGLSLPDVHATFAGYFAGFYLGLEVVVRLLVTILFFMFGTGATYVIFLMYVVLTIVSCLAIANLQTLSDHGHQDYRWSTTRDQFLSTMKIAWEDIRLFLMIPLQVSFGLINSFIPFYVMGTIVRGYLGSEYIGVLSALPSLIGAIIAIPSSFVANKIGKPFVMSIGGVCLFCCGIAIYIWEDETLGSWPWMLLYLTLYGIAKATWVSVCSW